MDATSGLEAMAQGSQAETAVSRYAIVLLVEGGFNPIRYFSGEVGLNGKEGAIANLLTFQGYARLYKLQKPNLVQLFDMPEGSSAKVGYKVLDVRA